MGCWEMANCNLPNICTWETKKKNMCKAKCESIFPGNAMLIDGCKCYCEGDANRYHYPDLKKAYLFEAFNENPSAQQEFFLRYGYDPYIDDAYNPCLNNAILVNGEYKCVTNANETTPILINSDGTNISKDNTQLTFGNNKNLYIIIAIAILLILILT